MKQKIVPIAVSSGLLGLVFDWLFYGKIPGVSVFLFTFLILSFTAYFIWQFQKPINKTLYWLAPLTLLFSFMVFVRANGLLAFINICLTLYLLLAVVRLARDPSLDFRQFGLLRYVTLAFSTPVAIVRRSSQFLIEALSYRRSPKSSVLPIVRGLLIALPVLGIFLILLSSADPVFKQYIGSLFAFNVNYEFVFRFGLVGFIASLFMGAYALMFLPASTPDIEIESEKIGLKLGNTEAMMVLGSVAGLFLLFVFIQLAYLFGGADQIASTGYTYAEYARKGFFELIAVAAISLALILTIKKSVTFQAALMSSNLKWLSGILIAEVLVIMLSAHMRLNLYEDAYGFTALRLISHLFIFWLAIAFWLLLMHIIKGDRDQQYSFQLFVSSISFLVLINFINPDAFIARQNINRYHETGKIDLQYLSNLSQDATPEIAHLLSDEKQNVRGSAANILFRQKKYTPSTDNWQSVNVAKERAKQTFRANADQIEAASGYYEYPISQP